MIQSVFGSSLLMRVKRHHALLETLRKAYLGEMRRRGNEEPLPTATVIQCRNVSLAVESAQGQLARLEAAIEEAEAVTPQAEGVQP
jgi:hypothetical protein